jgi:hypothetical protein
LPLAQDGVQRTSRRPIRFVVIAMLAALVAVAGLASPPAAEAAAKKVVIIVGPVGSKTADYIYSANKLADQARSYGAAVYKVYSPYATWAKVKSVAQGANLLIYLGHGNGWPSPYCCFQRYTKDGFGLNATAGNGNSNVKYWGEYYIDRYINLAPRAVVIMHRLCYASGNSEWGAPNPTQRVAVARVDNYAAGFLRANAKAIFSIGLSRPHSIISDLFRTNRTMKQIFQSAPDFNGAYDFGFSSYRTPGYSALMDPTSPGSYYRSVIGSLGMTAAQWRG